jgi:four helix bundle protein
MTNIKSFRDLLVWQKAMDLTVNVYGLARRLQGYEQKVLGYQLRKSALSIPSNVAEGCGRRSTPHFIQHLWIAHASGGELETQLEVGRRLGLVGNPDAAALTRDAQEVGRMLNGLARSLKHSIRSSRQN